MRPRYDTYGHWWIEMGAESYGWWPKNQVGLWGTLISVPGEVNASKFGGLPNRDPHHGDTPDESYVPERMTWAMFIWTQKELKYGSAKGKCCKSATLDEIKDCVRTFAGSYSGRWSYPWGQNCHAFVEDALSNCCMEEP